MDNSDIIYGRNTVREAVKNPQRVERVLVQKDAADGSIREILKLARDNRIPVIEVERKKLDEMTLPFGYDGRPANHQGIAALVPAYEYCEIEDILAYANEKSEPPFVILLDGVTDANNFGSVIRSAEVFGAHGIIVAKRRSAPLNSAVAKAASGAAENMRIARVVNLTAAIEKLQAAGVWVGAAVMDGTTASVCDMKGAFALAIGSEGEGLTRLVREKCDFQVTVPMLGETGSLNAAVAAAVLMYEKRRQDMQK